MTKSTARAIAYKPLGMSPLDGDEDEELAEDVLEVEDDNNDAIMRNNSNYDNDDLDDNDIIPFTRHINKFNLRHLRRVLYLIALVLFLIFIVQLTTSDTNLRGALTPVVSTSRLEPLSSKLTSGANIIESYVENNLSKHKSNTSSSSSAQLSFVRDARPQYESYLSSITRDKSHNDAITDDFHFPPVDEQSNTSSQISHTASAIWWMVNFRGSNKYVTVTNYIRAMKSFNYNSSITLTTQATTEFMYHSLELCKRWDGPISIAVFCPGSELPVATTLIKYMRQCLPGPLSACIRDKITWHLVYNRAHGPPSSKLSYPRFHLDSTNYPLFINQEQCPKLAGPDPSDSIMELEEELRRVNGISPSTYRQQFHLPYPINVLRNTARLAATTQYVLASDIELYPSINLVPSFVNFIKNHDIQKEYPNVEKYIFTLPIFEVKSNVTAPRTKKELIKLLLEGNAIFFHKWVCDACQNFPNRMDWLQTDKFGLNEFQGNDDELTIFEVTQRDKTKEFWEPIFIGTNDDPLYDDRLTWEGRRDKMGQMYEMCLQNKYLFVLGNAFLVHAPGIKHIDNKDVMKRLDYIRENNSIFDATISRLKQQYSNSGNLNKC